ncbi:MAG: hypothetical protein HOP29_09865 [Phycisphaerales bacterium]|nr:hypothetical protein [Phycisphaerales bacterium]
MRIARPMYVNRGLPLVVALVAAVVATSAPAALIVPPGFDVHVVARGFNEPVAIAFTPDGRLFVVERGGLIHIVTTDGDILPAPFIDLSAEVETSGDRGLMNIALHPSFSTTPWLYLVYAAKIPPTDPPIFGIAPTYGRLVRVLADAAQSGNVANLDSMEILIGQSPDEGFIHCYASHLVGTIEFANDASLFVGMGDGAHFEEADAGGQDAACFAPPLFDPVHDVGAFRAQHLDSQAGKILRIDPETGGGLPTNPYWTGNAADVRSKVWAYGLRNPFHFVLQPGTGSPERLWIADVGWLEWEEIDVADGGENFGWPCRDGPVLNADYQPLTPAHSGCDTIETPGNPGPLTGPVAWFHHFNKALSGPPGVISRCILAGAFYQGDRYPPPYRGKLFIGDHVYSWINVVDPDTLNSPGPNGALSVQPLATGAGRPVGFATHPDTGDVYYIPYQQNRIHHIEWVSPPADIDFDADVDLVDFARFQSCVAAGIQPGCAAFNADADNDVDVFDFDAFRDAVGQH